VDTVAPSAYSVLGVAARERPVQGWLTLTDSRRLGERPQSGKFELAGNRLVAAKKRH
jgi:hypothetical protein